jgi:3-deoxy-D-manno-octulosonic-acid transferase
MWITIYTALLWLFQPVYIARLYWRGRKNPGYRQRWRERIGHITPPKQPGSLWIHAVSVGETQAIAPFIEHLLDKQPNQSIHLSNSTPTGSAQARRLFGERVQHSYLPYDLPSYIRRILRTLQPSAILLVETELWPNLLRESARQQIPVTLVNARLSTRSQRGYQRLAYLTGETVARLHSVAAQTKADAQRLHSLGIPWEKIEVTGNLKYDQPNPDPKKAQALRKSWPTGPIWIAASTHEGEDQIILTAHTKLRQQHPNALLILVPRHPERFNTVAALIQQSEHQYVRRSEGTKPNSTTSVYLGDTMGELNSLIGTADIAYIGGSLVNTGGHNMLEAVAQGIPVCYGPHTYNFAQMAKQLLENGAAQLVTDANSLANTLHHWLNNPPARATASQIGQDTVRRNQGAIEKLYQHLYRKVK